jgi:hypothetical protein
MKSIKERDESERLALLETVRARTIEHAFQYDMELAIQRAADGMIASQSSIPQGSNNGNSKKCSLLEEENAGLCVQLSDEELKVVICVCVYIYVYIYIWIYGYIYMYIYICPNAYIYTYFFNIYEGCDPQRGIERSPTDL